MMNWFTAKDLAGLPGMYGNERDVRTMARRNKWRSKKIPKRGKEIIHYHFDSLPEGTQEAIRRKEEQKKIKGQARGGSSEAESERHKEKIEEWDEEYDAAKNPQKQMGQMRAEVVRETDRLMQEGMKLKGASEEAAAGTNISARWAQNFFTHEKWRRWRDLLLESDHLMPLAFVGKRPSGRPVTKIDEDMWEDFRCDYLRLEKPDLAACYERVKRIAGDEDKAMPSIDVFRLAAQKLPKWEVILKREGEEAVMRRGPQVERSVSSMPALDTVNGDGYKHNVWVQMPGGKIGRPVTWFWQDAHSRKILAYQTDVSENAEMIKASSHQMFSKWGLPRNICVDNTRAAANKMLTGGMKTRYRHKVDADEPEGAFAELGIKVRFTAVDRFNGKNKGRGQAKPVERAFGNGGFGEYVDKHPYFTGAYTGTGPKDKPPNYGQNAVTLDEFIKVLSVEIGHWNKKEGRRTEMCGGVKSFDQAFQESYENTAIRVATKSQLKRVMMRKETVKVNQQNHITLKAGNVPGHNRNRYYHGKLIDLAGQKVKVAYDPEDLHQPVAIYAMEGDFICEATCAIRGDFNSAETAKEVGHLRNKHMRMAKEAGQSKDKIREIKYFEKLKKIVPDGEVEAWREAKILEPQFGKESEPAGEISTEMWDFFEKDLDEREKALDEEKQRKDDMWEGLGDEFPDEKSGSG